MKLTLSHPFPHFACSLGGVVDGGLRSHLVDEKNDEVNNVHVDPLRLAVDNVGRLLGRALDSAFPGHHFSDATDRGEGLEHFHSYANTAKEQPQEQQTEELTSREMSTTVMDLHTDAGVLIVMTQGFVPGQDADSHELYLKLKNNDQLVKAVTASPDDLIVLVGEGGGADFMYVLDERERL